MSRSGEQLYVVDKYSDDDPRPLLEIMADPRASSLCCLNQDGKLRNAGSVFYHGLEMFERLSLFAAAYVSSRVAPSNI